MTAQHHAALQALADLEADMRAYVFWDRWKASIWLERLAAIRKALACP